MNTTPTPKVSFSSIALRSEALISLLLESRDNFEDLALLALVFEFGLDDDALESFIDGCLLKAQKADYFVDVIIEEGGAP